MSEKKIDYFWAKAIVQITGIVFLSQVVVEMLAYRKPGFEWVVYACGAAFFVSMLYASILILINAMEIGISTCPSCGQEMHPTDWTEQMQERLRQAEAELVKARDTALEDAEKACDDILQGLIAGYHTNQTGPVRACMDAIRAMKGKP